jgi:hypothetical protein
MVHTLHKIVEAALTAKAGVKWGNVLHLLASFRGQHSRAVTIFAAQHVARSAPPRVAGRGLYRPVRPSYEPPFVPRLASADTRAVPFVLNGSKKPVSSHQQLIVCSFRLEWSKDVCVVTQSARGNLDGRK